MRAFMLVPVSKQGITPTARTVVPIWARTSPVVAVSNVLGRLPPTKLRVNPRPVCAMSTASSGLHVLDGDEAGAMARISAARVSCKAFLDKPVDKQILESILQVTQRAPTSFNTQPYRLVVVSSKEAKEALAATMMETNKAKVLAAGATVVVLADLQVDGNKTSELTKAAAPQMSGYADMIPSLLPIFAGSKGKNTVAEWAFKNAGLVGMRLLDAATAHGLATAILEGIDSEQAMLEAIHAPASRYRVPFVICIGHPDIEAESARLDKFASQQTPRFSLDDIVSYDSLN
mmetsp:Transcript_26282/g.67974  ORF Transcript_26282/g.67974 Transcript_26282/m.67974 type:complete len:289 (+) Transcript_26282:163-1029(+)